MNHVPFWENKFDEIHYDRNENKWYYTGLVWNMEPRKCLFNESQYSWNFVEKCNSAISKINGGHVEHMIQFYLEHYSQWSAVNKSSYFRSDNNFFSSHYTKFLLISNFNHFQHQQRFRTIWKSWNIFRLKKIPINSNNKTFQIYLLGPLIHSNNV